MAHTLGSAAVATGLSFKGPVPGKLAKERCIAPYLFTRGPYSMKRGVLESWTLSKGCDSALTAFLGLPAKRKSSSFH